MGAITPGQIFANKYRVERILGRGGMGLVALASHLELQTHVALKLLDGERGSPQRLLREGRAAARLQGEHAARILDTGLEGDTPFLVMEFVRGKNLAQVLIEGGPMPCAEAVDLALQACEALAEAHALGIIHRDIKPSNLMLGERPDGTPLLKVLDFGIAKNLLEEGASLTGSAVLLGSPKYVAPEQVRDARAASPASDVWSLGVTLYELLTGQAPFDGPVIPGILAQIVADAPLPPRELRPALPEDLEALLLRCLSKLPADRPGDAAELASLLAPFGTDSGRLSARRAALTAERLRHHREPLPQETVPLGAPTPPADPGATAPESWPPRADGTAELGTTVLPPAERGVRLVSPGRLGLLLVSLLAVVGFLGALRSPAPSRTAPLVLPPEEPTTEGASAGASAALPPPPATPAISSAPPVTSAPLKKRSPRGPRMAPAPGDDLGPRLLRPSLEKAQAPGGSPFAER